MTRPSFYSAFGLRLRTDRPIPGPVPDAPPGRVDTRIWFAAAPPSDARDSSPDTWYRSPFLEAGGPAVTVSRVAGGAYVLWRYSDGTEFVIDRGGRDIWARWTDSSTLEDTATYLLGPILGFVLRLRGVTCLHASAVEVDGRAVAFVGPPYAGKSTTAAAFARLGCRILSDDVVPIEDERDVVHVHAAYPQIRLWPDSVALLYGSAEALPRLTPNWDKRVLAADVGATGAVAPLPLGAVYVLGQRGADNGKQPVERIAPADALLALVANTYVSYLDDPAARGREFRTLGTVAAAVPVRRATPPADAAALPAFCERILDDVQPR